MVADEAVVTAVWTDDAIVELDQRPGGPTRTRCRRGGPCRRRGGPDVAVLDLRAADALAAGTLRWVCSATESRPP